MAKDKKLYFGTIHQFENEMIEYEYKPPIYGESNTDISYYEPNATRIANMRKSASSLSTGMYDFDTGKINPKNVDMSTLHAGLDRQRGYTFEEIAQIQRNNELVITSQAKDAENANKAKKENAAEQVEIAQMASDAINKNSGSKSE